MELLDTAEFQHFPFRDTGKKCRNSISQFIKEDSCFKVKQK